MLVARQALRLGSRVEPGYVNVWDVAARWLQAGPALLAASQPKAQVLENKGADKMYVDRLKVTARAGNGGSGCASFWRSASKGKFRPADGGDGGDGGNVIIRASSNMKSLAGVPQLLKAAPGTHGSRQKLHGRKGSDTIVLVPTGTVVSKLMEDSSELAESEDVPDWLAQWRRPWVGADHYTSDGENEDNQEMEGNKKRKRGILGDEHQTKILSSDDENSLKKTEAANITTGSRLNSGTRTNENEGYYVIADLVNDGDEVIAAQGGHGGRGNAAARALPHRPAPSTIIPSTPGESVRLLLELKLIADVALVGLPNVGKSSLLRALSSATPRVGDYAFTTLRPQLGSIPLGFGRRLTVADVPGLIEGAHQNRGLGHRFLRHVERASALAFVVDASGGLELNTNTKSTSTSVLNSSLGLSLKPWDQLELIRREVAEYSSDLLTRPWMVIVNKIDLVARPGVTLSALKKRGVAAGAAAVVGVSATGGESEGAEPQGVDELIQALEELIE